MRYWKNTNTLDAHVSALEHLASPGEAEIAVIGSKAIDLDQFPRLKGVFKCGIGTDNVPFEECKARDIAVGLPGTATAEVIYEETANFAVYLILAMLYARAGSLDGWAKHPRPFLGRRNVLVIGTGNIGRRVHEKLTPLTNVLTFDIATHPESDLEALVRQAEVVSLHIPLTDETRNWFNREKLGWMADEAILVNTARAAIVPESDLHAEIQSGRIRAAFDVFWREPYEGELRRFHPDRFLMTPHIASTCEDFLSGLARDLRAFEQTLGS